MCDEFACCIVVGWSILGFASFLLSDIPRWARRQSWRTLTNIVGLAALTMAIKQVLDSTYIYPVPLGIRLLGGIGLIVFGLLLLYTTFLEPYRSRPRHTERDRQESPVIVTGTFALSRHPDTLWLIGWLISFAVALPTQETPCLLVIWMLLKLVFSAIQDRWLYPSILEGYEGYRREVPYLLPTKRSMKHAYRTWRGEHEAISREDK